MSDFRLKKKSQGLKASVAHLYPCKLPVTTPPPSLVFDFVLVLTNLKVAIKFTVKRAGIIRSGC